MNIKIIIHFIIVLLLFNRSIDAQKITIKEHYKYWYYRYRLTEEFVITGMAPAYCEASGLSIPAACAKHYHKTDPQLSMYWLENSVQVLGYYIGVLATELKLLYFYGQPYANTQQELYYAMKAYERLDRNCEGLFYPRINTGCPGNGNLNGLFCRDDVPKEFLYDGFGNESFRDKNDYTESIYSVYKSCGYSVDNPERPEGNYLPSMEELRGLFTGFALLKKALSGCPNAVKIYNGYDFVENAIDYTTRFMNRLRDDGWMGILEKENPNDEDDLYNHGEKYLGEFAAYGLAKAADCIVTSSRPRYSNEFLYNDPFRDLAFTIPLCMIYPHLTPSIINSLLDLEQRVIDYQKWAWFMRGSPHSGITCPLIPFVWTPPIYGISYSQLGFNCYISYEDENVDISLQLNEDIGIQINDYFYYGDGNLWPAITALAYASIGNSWKNDDGHDITYESIMTYIGDNHHYLWPLLNLYLWDKNKDATQLRKNLITDLISAPCEGPLSLPNFSGTGGPNIGVVGWRSGNKWISSTESALNGITDGQSGAKYNGLDYMLAYNLLWLECIRLGRTAQAYYIEPTSYSNGRDNNYMVYSGSTANTYFKFGNCTMPAGTFNSKNVNVIGENITINGNVEFGTGHTYNFITYPKINYCDVKNYLEQ